MAKVKGGTGKQRVSNLRAKARKKLSKRKTSNFTKCYWCGQSIIWNVSPDLILKTTPSHYFLKDVVEPIPRVTVDHVIPIVVGGNNHESNLVASCYECNVNRPTKIDTDGLVFYGNFILKKLKQIIIDKILC